MYFPSVKVNNEDGSRKSDEQIAQEMEEAKEKAAKATEEFHAKMKAEAHDNCQNCGLDITGLHFVEVNSMMRYIPRTHCNPCHNLSILGIGPFEHERTIGEGDDQITFSGHPVGKGWMPIVIELNEQLTKLHPEYVIVQVKEKFGGLSYYTADLPLYNGTEEEARAEADEHTKIILECKEKGEEPPYEKWKAEREESYTEAYKLIKSAQKKCLETCEDCGEPGELSCEPEGHVGWIQTLCPDCRGKDGKITMKERREQEDVVHDG